MFPCVCRGSTVSANKALELVRAALQPSLNAEIEAVLKSYQEVFDDFLLYHTCGFMITWVNKNAPSDF